MRARQGRLGLGAHRPDDSRTKRFGPLAGDQANATSGGMNQYRLAGANTISSAQQILSGQALQHHRSGGVEVNRVR